MRPTAAWSKKLHLTWGCVFALAGALFAQEQESETDRPTRLGEPVPSLPMTEAPVFDAITLFPDAADGRALESGLDNHPWKFVLHGRATATYDSNIFITHADEQEDFIFTMAPGLAVGRGDFQNELTHLGSSENLFNPDRSGMVETGSYFFLHYVPSVTLYADHPSEDSFDHDVTLDGRYEWQRLTLGIAARFQTMNLPDLDLGERVERRLFSGAVTSRYECSPRASVELNFFHFMSNYSGERVDSMDSRWQAWMNYQAGPRLTMGVGFTHGRVDLSRGPDQSYEQVLARLRYRPSDKIRFDLTAGGEIRDIDGLPSQSSGVFSLGVSYAPFDGTTILLQGYRRTVTSAAAPSANYDLTGVDAQVRQRIAQRYFIVLAAGCQQADYDYFAPAAPRLDEIFYIHPSVGIELTNWLSCEIGVSYRRNSSSRQQSDFSETTGYFQVNVFF